MSAAGVAEGLSNAIVTTREFNGSDTDRLSEIAWITASRSGWPCDPPSGGAMFISSKNLGSLNRFSACATRTAISRLFRTSICVCRKRSAS